MRYRALAVVAVLATVAALTACGEGGDDDGAGGGSNTTAGADTVPPVTISNGTDGPTVPPDETSTSSPSTPALSSKPLPPASTPPVSIPAGTPVDPSMPLVVAAVEDLAGRLGIEPAEVIVAEALAVTWPDGSLGCPEPGMMYTQVLVDGTFVLLEAAGRQYEYHGGSPLLLCEPGKGPVRGG